MDWEQVKGLTDEAFKARFHSEDLEEAGRRSSLDSFQPDPNGELAPSTTPT